MNLDNTFLMTDKKEHKNNHPSFCNRTSDRNQSTCPTSFIWHWRMCISITYNCKTNLEDPYYEKTYINHLFCCLMFVIFLNLLKLIVLISRLIQTKLSAETNYYCFLILPKKKISTYQIHYLEKAAKILVINLHNKFP